MKLLIFSVIFQIFMNAFIGFNFFILNHAQASEIVDSYEVRFQRWQEKRKDNRSTLDEGLKKLRTDDISSDASSKLKVLDALNASRQPQSASGIQEQEPSLALAKVLPKKIATENQTDAEHKSIADPAAVTRKNIDAQEDFLNQIPKSNKQVQTLLTMIDHAKVYYSINSEGRLKDLFQDERFKEIYTQEMEPSTRKSTYLFFKGYQDHNRNPNEPIKPKLNRDTKITREKLEGYLETSGIKSKLTRSLTGTYPKLPKNSSVAESENAATETVNTSKENGEL